MIRSFAKDYGSKYINLYPKTTYTTDSAATKKGHLNSAALQIELCLEAAIAPIPVKPRKLSRESRKHQDS